MGYDEFGYACAAAFAFLFGIIFLVLDIISLFYWHANWTIGLSIGEVVLVVIFIGCLLKQRKIDKDMAALEESYRQRN